MHSNSFSSFTSRFSQSPVFSWLPRQWYKKPVYVIPALVGFAVIATALILFARAATNPELEAENATLSGQVSTVSDTTASGGKALRFGAGASSGSGSTTGGSGVAWPLKVSDNKRNLVDQNGKAFLYTADTAWTMIPYLNLSDAKKLIDIRKSQGFNTIQVNLVGWTRTKAGPNGVPFQNGDVTKPVESYWQVVDQVMAYAKAQDMLLNVGPMPTGNNSNMDTSAMKTYGTWVGQRYKNQGNLLWYVGHDSSPSQDYAANSAEAAAIKAQIPAALITYHMVGLAYPWENNAPNESWYGYYGMQWNGVVSPYPYEIVADMYNHSPTRPVLDIEPAYEPANADPTGPSSTTPLYVRKQSWWAKLAGAMGVVYGGPVTAWNIGADAAANWDDVQRAPAEQVGKLRAILEKYSWEKLLPDSGTVTGGSDHVQTGVADDKSLIVSYTPGGGTLTVNLSKLGGAGTAQWFDPVSGQTSGSAQAVANSGTKAFAAPGKNAGGDSDWVLVLKQN